MPYPQALLSGLPQEPARRKYIRLHREPGGELEIQNLLLEQFLQCRKLYGHYRQPLHSGL
ncbi:MAG: hypothetical protein NHB15_01250 [Methanosarcina barkeri]|nr:hypothetical protein [Methanosarcina sp. ERenArc_MAG2]